MAGIGRFEGFVIEALVLALAVWQLISVRREIRQDKEMAAREAQDGS
jgi:hypothetical protein